MAQDRRRCLIIPAAGLGSRFAEKGYKEPKPFIPINGVPMIELVVRNMCSILGQCRVIVVLRDSMNVKPPIIEGVEYTYVPTITQGAANTVLHALKLVDDDSEVVVANSDQLVELDPFNFNMKCESDGTIVTFRCPDRNPKWSYADVDENGYVTRVAEKVAISEHATVGIYRYATARLLHKSISRMIQANDRTNGEFYLCPAFNHMPPGTHVNIVDAEQMWGLGTPEDLENSLQNTDFTTFITSLR